MTIKYSGASVNYGVQFYLNKFGIMTVNVLFFHTNPYLVCSIPPPSSERLFCEDDSIIRIGLSS